MLPNIFLIEDVKVDIVYGKATSFVTKDPYVFNLKTSVQFVENDHSLTYSGSPGYIKGNPLLIGQPLSPPASDAGTVDN